MNLETELYGIDAATAYAKELIADLNNQRALKKQEEQQLTAKFAKIQDFEAKAVSSMSIPSGNALGVVGQFFRWKIPWTSAVLKHQYLFALFCFKLKHSRFPRRGHSYVVQP